MAPPTNVYFSPSVWTEQMLYEDLIIEGLRLYGQDVMYIPRVSIKEDEILNEDYSRFEDAYAVEMYIANTQGFEGEGTLLSKFGLEIRDQATFIVAKRRFRQLVEIDQNEVRAERPREGDLIYLPLSNSLFEIKFVEHEQPFYRLDNLPIYELQCELFEYSSEKIDTGIPGVDQFETEHASQTVMEIRGGTEGFFEGERIYQFIQEGRAATATVTAVVDSLFGTVTDVEINESGYGYEDNFDVDFPLPRTGTRARGTAIVDSEGSVTDVTITDQGSGYVGDVRFDLQESPQDDVPEIRLTAEVYQFEQTQEADEETDRVGDLYVVGVTSSDGETHTFTEDNGNIYREDGNVDSGWSVVKVYSLSDPADKYIPDEQEGYADNTAFEIEGDSILDFSEINPFGDPRENE